jgi:inosose dehydratase
MSVRLGVSPIAWSNDDLPELGGDTPLETCLAEARDAGFAGIELGNKFPREERALRPILQHHGLVLVSGWYSGRLLDRSTDSEWSAMARHRDLLTAMGCTVLVYAETTGGIAGDRSRALSTRPRLSDEEWRDFGGKLTEIARRLAQGGLGLAYHHHMGTIVEDQSDIDRLMAVTGDTVGLLLDTGHLVFAGADPRAVTHRHARRVNHVHCKDVRADVLARVRAADSSFLDAVLAGVFTVPGDGMIDFARALEPLSAANYDGWLVVEAEQDPAKAPPLPYARKGIAHLRAAAAAAELGKTS